MEVSSSIRLWGAWVAAKTFKEFLKVLKSLFVAKASVYSNGLHNHKCGHAFYREREVFMWLCELTFELFNSNHNYPQLYSIAPICLDLNVPSHVRSSSPEPRLKLRR